MSDPIKSYKLTIYKEDDSVYWVEHSDSIDRLTAWLEEEMTRFYWNPAYTHEIIEEI